MPNIKAQALDGPYSVVVVIAAIMLAWPSAAMIRWY